MNFFLVSSILIAITNFGIAILVLSKGWRNSLHRTLSYIAFSSGVWGLGGCIYAVASQSQYELALLGWQISYSGSIIVGAFFAHFIFKFLNLKKQKMVAFIYIIGIVFIFFNWYDRSSLFIGNLSFVFNEFYWHDWVKNRNPIYLLFYITYYWILLIYSFMLLIFHYKDTTGLRREQVKYFIVGSVIGWLGAHSDFLPVFGINKYPYPNLLIALYPAIWTYAIIRYRLLDIRMVITRAGIALAVYAVLFGIPFYLGAKFNNWFLSTSIAVILAVPAPIIYRYFRIKAERILLAQQQRYQKILIQAGTGMVKEHNLTRLLKLIVYIVKRVVGITYAAAFSHDADNNNYVLRVIRDHRGLSTGKVFGGDEPLIDYIRKNAFPMSPQEIPYNLRRPLEEAMGTSFDLIVPSVVEGNMLGFLLLGNKLDNSAYSHDDINVFQILSHQASLAIENCIFFDEFKKAQERIFNAEKLASIGGMADGVAHQIKNRLNHFSIASGELKFELDELAEKHPEMKEDPGCVESFNYMKKITDSLLENVKRTDAIIKGILGYSRTAEKDVFFDYFSLREVLNLSLELLLIKHKLQQFPLDADLESVDLIWGVKAQIMEAVYNLLDNAYEATIQKTYFMSDEEKEAFKPKITLEVRETESNYLMKISDNGIGIKEEDMLKIFAPFFTTKSSYKNMAPGASGTGIGMYVVKRLIVENHNGKIKFDSEYMKGTTFLIELPKKNVESIEENNNNVA